MLGGLGPLVFFCTYIALWHPFNFSTGTGGTHNAFLIPFIQYWGKASRGRGGGVKRCTWQKAAPQGERESFSKILGASSKPLPAKETTRCGQYSQATVALFGLLPTVPAGTHRRTTASYRKVYSDPTGDLQSEESFCHKQPADDAFGVGDLLTEEETCSMPQPTFCVTKRRTAFLGYSEPARKLSTAFDT